MTDPTFDAFTPAAAPAVGSVPIPPPGVGDGGPDDAVYVPEHSVPVRPEYADAVEALAGPPPAAPDGAHLMPSGAWVQTIDARTLTRGDKKQILRGGMVEGDDIDRGYGLFDALLARLVTAWSYPHPIPSVDLSVMDLLPAEDDDALTELAKDAERLLFPKAPSPDDHDNPASPTAPSSE